VNNNPETSGRTYPEPLVLCQFFVSFKHTGSSKEFKIPEPEPILKCLKTHNRRFFGSEIFKNLTLEVITKPKN
jgi:hypothetical protein